MTALAILVKFTIPEGSMDKFMEAAHYDAKHSMQDEPGCQQFRILVPDDEPNTVYFSRFTMIKRPSMHIVHNRIMRSTPRLPRRLASPGNALALPC